MTISQNLLDYIRSQGNVDCDSQDVQVATKLGPFSDCTSNQIDSYFELTESRRSDLLRKSVAVAAIMRPDFPNIPFEELATEVAMVDVALTMAPLVSGLVFVMANPQYANSSLQLLHSCQRIADIAHKLDPAFELSRLGIKVVATWEGLQACRKASQLGIKTLATTLFTMEQAILAAEVGCVYISPFLHTLRAVLDGKDDPDENLIKLCVNAQAYYEQHLYSTNVKAAAIMSTDEAVQLAGIAAMTLPPAILEQLASSNVSPGIELQSLLNGKKGAELQKIDRLTFVNDEERYRAAFGSANDGRGKARTEQAISIFCEYQSKLQMLMRKTAAELGLQY